MKLPVQDWQKLPGAQTILAALGAVQGDTRVVGGAVRDALLGLPVHDVDLATRLTPTAVLQQLTRVGVKPVPTGIDHGTITAVAPDIIMEVTTLRRDVSTDGRRATIEFTDDWREDAARRDFTINALSANADSGEIFDYFGGVDDLAARRIRFIGNPLDRIAEDHLRIMRFFRFHARFGKGEPDPEAVSACAARANDLMALSRERIRDELLKLLTADDPIPATELMLDHGILKPVLPEIDHGRIADLRALVGLEGEVGADPSGIRRLAALLPPDAATVEDIARRLKLSNADRRMLVSAAGRSDHDRETPYAALGYRLGKAEAIDRLLLTGARPASIRALAAWERPGFPLGGGALVERGVTRGPEVSRLLKAIEEDWIAAGFPTDKAILEDFVRRRLAQSAPR